MGTAQASGIALVAAARRGMPVRPAHAQRGQGRRLRQRARGQGPGRRDGRPGSCGSTRRRSPRTPPTRSRSPSPTSGAGARRPGSTPRSPRHAGRPSSRKEPGMIAFVRGEVAAVTLTRAVRRGRGSRARADVYAEHARHAAHRPARHPADEHGRARGLADPVRLPRRRREVTFELVQTASGVGPKLAQAMLAVLAPDDLRRAVAERGRQDPDPGARHRAEGRPADHPRAEGPDRRPDRRPRKSAVVPRAAPTGATRSSQGLVGLGWSTKEADKAVDGGAPTRPVTPPTSAPCCAPPSGCLSKA